MHKALKAKTSQVAANVLAIVREVQAAGHTSFNAIRSAKRSQGWDGARWPVNVNAEDIVIYSAPVRCNVIFSGLRRILMACRYFARVTARPPVLQSPACRQRLNRRRPARTGFMRLNTMASASWPGVTATRCASSVATVTT